LAFVAKKLKLLKLYNINEKVAPTIIEYSIFALAINAEESRRDWTTLPALQKQ